MTAAERGCQYAEQAVGLALHALEPADEELLAEHVPHCSTCQEQVRHTQDVVWGLAAGAEQRDPPDRLRSSLMSKVAATEQLPVEHREERWVVQAEDAGGHRGGPDRLRAGHPGADRPSAELRQGWSGRLTGRRRLLALVATVAVAAVGVGGVAIELVARARQQDQTTLTAPSPEVSRLLAEADRAGARHAVLYAPDGEVVAAVAQFPASRQVMPIRLPANEADHTVYVLWGIGAGRPTAIGMFDVAVPSSTMLPVGPTTNVTPYSGYAISIENNRSMPLSPGLVVASGRVAS